jgi:ABC-type antimicrobial peptide transport system permease subunit
LTIIRWILLVPGAILAWYVALFLGIVALDIRDSLCPSEYMVSGMCTGLFGKITFDTLMVFFSGISALLVVIASTLIAPTNKGIVAITAFVVGSVVASVFLFGSDFELWKEFVSAITVGGATCYFIVRKQPIRRRVE